jgi:hypothetical protein
MPNKTNDVYKNFFKSYDPNEISLQVKGDKADQVASFKDCLHTSFEKVPIAQLDVLLGYLRYSICAAENELHEKSSFEKEYHLKRLIRNKELLNNIMSSNNSYFHYSTNEFLVRKVCFDNKSPYLCDNAYEQPLWRGCIPETLCIISQKK